MATVAELRQALDEKRADLKQLEADLPRFERLQAQAHEDALNARRTQNLGKRLELHTRHTQLAAVYAEQEDAIDGTRALIADLEQELADALEAERVEKVIAWAKGQQRKGAEAFEAAYMLLNQAADLFNEVDAKVHEERSKHPDGTRGLGRKLGEVQPFGFKRVMLRGRGLTQRVDRYALRLKRAGFEDLFGDLQDTPL